MGTEPELMAARNPRSTVLKALRRKQTDPTHRLITPVWKAAGVIGLTPV